MVEVNSSPDDLLAQLDTSGLSQEELQCVVDTSFPRAFMFTDSTVTYCRTDESPVLTAHFDGEQLVRLETDESMTVDERADLERAIATANAERDERAFTTVVFSRQPWGDQWWRYRDRFQLRTPPPEAPTADTLIGPHPIYLDFMFRTSESDYLSTARVNIQRRQVELLLNLFISERCAGDNVTDSKTGTCAGRGGNCGDHLRIKLPGAAIPRQESNIQVTGPVADR